MRVLVIDDEAAVRAMIRRMLEPAGHEVIEAENGRVGLDTYRKRLFDVVITDIFMPEKEGLETIREIRALDPKVRIVAISGGQVQDIDFLAFARDLGATVALAKPFRKEELIACVEGQEIPHD